MQRRTEIRAEAARELDDAVAYLNERSTAAGSRFLEAFQTATERLLTYPRAGRALSGRMRKWVMVGWKYTIIYTTEEYGIQIVAVAHHSRRPNYWRKRLR